MSKVVEMLEEKGIVERLHKHIDRTVTLFGKDVPQEEIDRSVKMILDFEFQRNPDLGNAFAEHALDIAMDSVVKELGIKYNPDSDYSKKVLEENTEGRSALLGLIKIICPF